MGNEGGKPLLHSVSDGGLPLVLRVPTAHQAMGWEAAAQAMGWEQELLTPTTAPPSLTLPSYRPAYRWFHYDTINLIFPSISAP